MTKQRARQLQEDFVPGGEPIEDPRSLVFRPTKEYEVHQCCASNRE